jgi:hypothetical protein
MRSPRLGKAANFRCHAPFSALKNDPEVAADLREHTVALIALPAAVHAAE